MVDGLLANVGIRIVFPIRSSSLATGAPVLMSTGTSAVAWCRKLMNSTMGCL